MDSKNTFKPYIPAERVTSELTITAVIMGILLSVIFGAANAYLGLKVGMTVSASIPAAVIGMGVIRVILRKNSVLESNMVQTIGSAGESLAAGAIFTMPALYMWASDPSTGIKVPSLITITIIALIGGLLGVFFMIPLRNALIVREHNTLPYPEGQACAEVMLAGEEGGSSASTVFAGMGFAALFKFIIDGLKVIPGEITLNIKKLYPGAIGTQIYPAVMSVGYICGPRISSYMFAGGVLSWLVLIPLIVIFGGDIVTIFSEGQSVDQLFNAGGAGAIYKYYVKYIGAGALAAGGIISLIKSLPTIVRTFADSVKAMTKKNETSSLRTDKDTPLGIVLAVIVLLTLIVWLVPAVPVSPLGAVIVVVFGFFFATVSSRMVGLVGSSNNPVSGMAIATVLLGTLILKLTGLSGAEGMLAAISIGSIICIVSAIAGDTSQDLKTGYLLGATPYKQQIGEIIGVVAAAFAIGATLNLLNSAWGFGPDSELSAPQASIMKLVVEGIMGGNLPWELIFIGVFIAIVIEILRLPVLPVAIGIYLPVQLNACIMVGGIIRLFFNRMKEGKRKESVINKGILFSSGMIAGEGLVGIIIAVLAVVGISDKINLSNPDTGVPRWAEGLSGVSEIAGLALFAVIIAVFLIFCFGGKKNKTEE